MPDQPSLDQPSDTSRAYWVGVVNALGAFIAWGVVNPLYMKALGAVSPFEIMSHRILWSSALALIIVAVTGAWGRLRQALRRRNLMLLTSSALLITLNWTIFLWSILNAHMVEAAFGYFINPLVSIALGVVVLGERLRMPQIIACAIAGVGIAVPIISRGTVPWIALVLAVTFGLYGLVRKVVRVDGLVGFAVEVSLLAPFAAAFLLWLAATGSSAFTIATPMRDALLIGTGAITTGPLTWFARAAQRLPLSTLGILQFISPTGGLLLGIFLYGEPFSVVEAIAFGCIWSALALYVADAMQAPRQAAAE